MGPEGGVWAFGPVGPGLVGRGGGGLWAFGLVGPEGLEGGGHLDQMDLRVEGRGYEHLDQWDQKDWRGVGGGVAIWTIGTGGGGDMGIWTSGTRWTLGGEM